MALKDNTRSYMVTGWIGLAAAYIILVMPRLNRPIVGWEALVWDIPRRIASHGYSAVKSFNLAPLYDSLIAASFKLSGISELSARLPGILSILAVPIVIYLIAKEITENKDAPPVAMIAGALFLTAPLVVQGSLVIDRPDTTILMLAMSLFYLALLKTEGRPLIYRAAFSGVLYAVCLWAKLTTPLACLAAVPLAYCMCGRFKEGLKVSAAIFAAGIGIFIISWGAFCYSSIGMERFYEPLGYYGTAAAGTVSQLSAGIFTRMVLDLFRIYLWLSPFLLILALLAALRLVKRPPHSPALRLKETQLLTFSCVVFAGYLYANATFSGFPKYIAPAVPMIACLAANYFWQNTGRGLERKERAFFTLSIFAGIAFYAVFVKDWIYAVYTLREAGLYGSTGLALRRVMTQQALYLGFSIVVFLASFVFIKAAMMKRLCLVLLATLLASNLALDLMQRKAAYSVNFAYGTEGAESLRAALSAKQKAEVYSSIEGFVANAGNAAFHNVSADIWDDPKRFAAFVEKYEPEYILYGLAANTVTQLKGTMRDPAVRAILDKDYDAEVFGSYNLLARRPHRI